MSPTTLARLSGRDLSFCSTISRELRRNAALGEAFITAVTCAEGTVRDERVDDELDGLVVEMSFDELADDLLSLS